MKQINETRLIAHYLFYQRAKFENHRLISEGGGIFPAGVLHSITYTYAIFSP